MTRSLPFHLIGALAFAAGLYLCSAPAEAASGRVTFKVGEQTRSAYVVERYRAKRKLRPTIIVLGDGARTSTASRRGLRFLNFSRAGGVLVYAESAGGSWNIGADGAAAADLAYLRALIAKLRRDSLADPRRIHIVGIGSGGIVALQAACNEARLFSGVAAALASLPKDQVAKCAPGRPISAMLLAGDADTKLPFNGGKADLRGFTGEVAPVEETLAAFARAASCSGAPVRMDLPNRDRADASQIVIERQSNCRARVRLVRVQGGGHYLPMLGTSSRRGAAGQNRDAATTALILSFFRL